MWLDYVTSRGQLLWGRNLRGCKRIFSPLSPSPTSKSLRAALFGRYTLCYMCICRWFITKIPNIKDIQDSTNLSFLFSMEWYWMQDQLIPTCLCTSGRSVILSNVQHLWNKLEVVQSLMMKVNLGSSTFCPSLYSLKVSP